MVERVDVVNRPPNRIRYGWTLYPTEWQLIPSDVLRTDQWQSTGLSRALRSSIPQQSGVYMMCVRPPGVASIGQPFSRLEEVVYVGKTTNLRRRYGQHLNVPSPKVRVARETYAESLRFWFLRLASSQISSVESVLISCLGPPGNDRPGEIQRLVVGPTNTVQSA